MSSWVVNLTEEVEDWLLELSKNDPDSADQVAAAIDMLEAEGPALGRPLVDHVKGSNYRNMKELRPGSAGTNEIRILFAFDPQREAILLVAGDKSGNWRGWYETSILAADQKFAEHLRELKGSSDGA
ncbi:type II toxin-antitoxin system RelE/ParE family toxin [Micromonospora avicenniae]|uniref:type II toxin-antitoxin system RelE/ParE family toxin n=1 Tax=Micromonospora avicenniae TaxID=1198245 RepID=UPI003443FC25